MGSPIRRMKTANGKWYNLLFAKCEKTLRLKVNAFLNKQAIDYYHLSPARIFNINYRNCFLFLTVSSLAQLLIRSRYLVLLGLRCYYFLSVPGFVTQSMLIAGSLPAASPALYYSLQGW
jgi:hypothetical protein